MAPAPDVPPGPPVLPPVLPPDPPPGLSLGLAALPPALRTPRLDPGRRGLGVLAVVALVGVVLAAVVVLRARPTEVTTSEVLAPGTPVVGATPVGSAAAGAPTAEVVVSVAGRVRRPGLVRLPAGSRVDDALRAAGGLLPGASVGLLNLARRLVDGEQVLVGVPAATTQGSAQGSPPGGSAGPLDLNAATLADLDALPGVGPVLAQRILDWRTEHGRFARVEQLREVKGIGESIFASLRPKVTV